MDNQVVISGCLPKFLVVQCMFRLSRANEPKFQTPVVTNSYMSKSRTSAVFNKHTLNDKCCDETQLIWLAFMIQVCYLTQNMKGNTYIILGHWQLINWLQFQANIFIFFFRCTPTKQGTSRTDIEIRTNEVGIGVKHVTHLSILRFFFSFYTP